jgi:DNA-binding transcriptional LysR family regulator
LDRSSRPLGVTPAGELYAAFCQDVLRRKQDLDEALVRLQQRVGGKFKIACIYSVGVSELVKLEREFSERNPESEVQVLYLRPEKVYGAVLAGEAELGLVSYPVANRDLVIIPWRREEMVLAAAPGHLLAKRALSLKGPLPLQKLQGASFVGFDEDLPIRRHVDRFFKEKEIEVDQEVFFDNIEMVKEAVAEGVGVGILPFRAMRDDIQRKRLTAIRLAGASLYRPLGIIYRKKKPLSMAAQKFLEMLRESAVQE